MSELQPPFVKSRFLISSALLVLQIIAIKIFALSALLFYKEVRKVLQLRGYKSWLLGPFFEIAGNLIDSK